MIGLRHGENIPVWVSHVLEIIDGKASMKRASPVHHSTQQTKQISSRTPFGVGELVADLQGVGVSYGNRKVFSFKLPSEIVTNR